MFSCNLGELADAQRNNCTRTITSGLGTPARIKIDSLSSGLQVTDSSGSTAVPFQYALSKSFYNPMSTFEAKESSTACQLKRKLSEAPKVNALSTAESISVTWSLTNSEFVVGYEVTVEDAPFTFKDDNYNIGGRGNSSRNVSIFIPALIGASNTPSSEFTFDNLVRLFSTPLSTHSYTYCW